GDPRAEARGGARRRGVAGRNRGGGPLGRAGVGRDRGRRAGADRAGVLRRAHAGGRRRLGPRAGEERGPGGVGAAAARSARAAGRGVGPHGRTPGRPRRGAPDRRGAGAGPAVVVVPAGGGRTVTGGGKNVGGTSFGENPPGGLRGRTPHGPPGRGRRERERGGGGAGGRP